MKKLVLLMCIFKSSRAPLETLDVDCVLVISLQILIFTSCYHRIRVIKFISSMDPGCCVKGQHSLKHSSHLNGKYLRSIFGNEQGLHRKEMLMAGLNMM